MVLTLVESEGDSEMGDLMLTLILAYNLQFKPNSTSNITVQTLNQVESVKIFTEKLLLLINREGTSRTTSHYHSLLPYYI